MDTPEFVESIKETVFLEEGLWWGVRHATDLDNAYRFLSLFTGLKDVKLSVEVESFRFTDDWLKLFESVAEYRVKLLDKPAKPARKLLFLTYSVQALGLAQRTESFKRRSSGTIRRH
ncbi:hypothetical protein AAVH_17572 [Aphelenchoides avenae]|nr:hypothetical protein AAVH_17572 [Aphelenchus avenae]